MLELPDDFIETILGIFGERGQTWLEALPTLIEDACRAWDLQDIQPVPNLTYNFVAFANRFKKAGEVINSTANEDEVILKIGVPDKERTSEIAALRLFNGSGAVRLLETDEARGMFVMERVRPGKTLASLADDERATHIAADVMLNIWRVPSEANDFIRLSDWFTGLEKLRVLYEGGTGPLEKSLVERAERSVADFFSEDYTPMLIHGDLHHFNILSSGRGWLAIDPKGVVGPAAYEVGPLLINPWIDFVKWPNAMQITQRRIAILSERLGFEPERIRDWGIAHAVLSAWWGLGEKAGWEYPMDCARILSKALL
jgi:streptomycin 6-kinase